MSLLMPGCGCLQAAAPEAATQWRQSNSSRTHCMGSSSWAQQAAARSQHSTAGARHGTAQHGTCDTVMQSGTRETSSRCACCGSSSTS